MDRPSCKTCPYFKDAQSDDKRDDYIPGVCFRYPPVFVGRNDVNPAECEHAETMWWSQPWVDGAGHVCGEHPRFPEYIRSLGIVPPDEPADDEIDFSEECGWTVRERKALRALGITTWSQLAGTTAEELMEQKNMGVMSVGSVIAKVHARGLRLKDERWEVKKYPLAKAIESDGQ